MVLSSVERNEYPNHMKKLKEVRPRLYLQIGVPICMDDEMWEWKLKEATNKCASLISSLIIGNEEMPIEEYVQLAGEKIVDI